MDSGNYALLQPLVISPLPGLGDDTQFDLKGSGIGSVVSDSRQSIHCRSHRAGQRSQRRSVFRVHSHRRSDRLLDLGGADAIRFKGIQATDNSLDGIQIAAGSKVSEITDSIISYNGRDGIRAQGQLQKVTSNNLSNNAGHGLLMQDGAGAVITGNVVHSNATGLNVTGHADVQENRVYNHSAVGVKATEANVQRNTIYSNAVGIQSDASSLVNNLVYDNAAVGISLMGTSGSELSITRFIKLLVQACK